LGESKTLISPITHSAISEMFIPNGSSWGSEYCNLPYRGHSPKHSRFCWTSEYSTCPVNNFPALYLPSIIVVFKH
jgi:hypothetical protein